VSKKIGRKRRTKLKDCKTVGALDHFWCWNRPARRAIRKRVLELIEDLPYIDGSRIRTITIKDNV
jgi:hypothetical protein